MGQSLRFVKTGRFIAGMIVVLFASTLFAEPEMRTWTDKETKKTAQAKYIKVEDGKVMLELESGKKAFLPLDKLSEDDADYIKSQQRHEEREKKKAETDKANALKAAAGQKKLAEIQKQLDQNERDRGKIQQQYEKDIADAQRGRQQAQDNANKAFNDQRNNSAKAYGKAMNGAQKQFQEDLNNMGKPRWTTTKRINLGAKGVPAELNAGRNTAKAEPKQKPAPTEWSLKLKKSPAVFSSKTPAKSVIPSSEYHPEQHINFFTSRQNSIGLVAFPIEPGVMSTKIAFVDLTGKKPPRVTSTPGTFKVLAFSPSGGFILAGQENSFPIHIELWKTSASGVEKVRSWDPTDMTQMPRGIKTDWACFTDDTNFVTRNDKGEILYWDVNKSDPVAAFHIDAGPGVPVVNGPNNLLIVSAASNIHVIDLIKLSVIGKKPTSDAESYLALSPAGQNLAVVSSSKVDIIDLATGKTTSSFDDQKTLAFAKSATWTTEKNLLLDNKHLLDVETGKVVWSYKGIEKPLYVQENICWFLNPTYPKNQTLTPLRIPHLDAMPQAGVSKLTDEGFVELKGEN